MELIIGLVLIAAFAAFIFVMTRANDKPSSSAPKAPPAKPFPRSRKE